MQTNLHERMYMPEIGKWMSNDPLADKYLPVSPYNYTLNNPVNLIDPTGKSAEVIVDEENKKIRVNLVIVFYGSGATKDNVDIAISTLNKLYNSNAGKDGYSDAGEGWKLKVSVSSIITDEDGASDLAKENEGNGLFNYVRVEEENAHKSVVANGYEDHKVSSTNGNLVFWITEQMKTTSPAHEIGHSLDINSIDHLGAEGIMVPGTNQRTVTPANISELRYDILSDGKDKSSLVDKYLFRVKRLNYGATPSIIYNQYGDDKNQKFDANSTN